MAHTEQNHSISVAYVGGGSMAWARIFMTDLALEPDLGGHIRLYDVDMDAAKNNEIIGNRITADSRARGKWRYTAVPSLREALDGADFVIISILPGSFEHMRSDVHLPERLGVYQPVGDTAGPGGIIRSLRTAPLFAGFAEAIRLYAPGAWVINYTNPMSVCVRTLYHVFPKIKAFGCCHEVFGTQALLADMLRRRTGEEAERGDIRVNVLGLNHFTWFDRAAYKETNLMDVFAEFAGAYHQTGYPGGGSRAADSVFDCNHRVKFDLFRRFGLIAAAGDRHLAEFMPGEQYAKDPETAREWGFHLTSADWRIADRAKKAEKTARLVSGAEDIALEPSGEEGILLIKALCGLTRAVSNVNLPNAAGQIGNLPLETVVETNAVFSGGEVRPAAAGDLPDEIRGLMLPHAENQTEVLRAALDCDIEAVCRAFERDPLLSGRCADAELRALARDMVRNTLGALPGEWRTVC